MEMANIAQEREKVLEQQRKNEERDCRGTPDRNKQWAAFETEEVKQKETTKKKHCQYGAKPFHALLLQEKITASQEGKGFVQLTLTNKWPHVTCSMNATSSIGKMNLVSILKVRFT